ncbi:MAG: lysophospholipase [Pseudonocardiaceae bacterium]
MSNRHTEGRRRIAPGRSIYWQAWLPPNQASAVIVIVHGFGEHSGRYGHVGNRLAMSGFAGYAADHRGHGRSDGRRANIERMTLIVADLGGFVQFAIERHPGLPVFMVGHSLGGLIALQYALERDVGLDGLVLSAPAVQVTTGSGLQRRLARMLSALLPDLQIAALDADQKISRDPEVIRAYREDPLVYHGRIKARTGAEILTTMADLPARLPQLAIPLLILHGTDDLICDPAGSAIVHDRVSCTDKTLRRYRGLYHELFNEPERDEVLTDLIHWLHQHLPRRCAGAAGSRQAE